MLMCELKEKLLEAVVGCTELSISMLVQWEEPLIDYF
jgi:hypothetical protein